MNCQRVPNTTALNKKVNKLKKELQSHVEKQQKGNIAKKTSNLINLGMNITNGCLGFRELGNSLTGQVSVTFYRKTMCHEFKNSQFYVSLV